jgi:outer membrane protein
MRKVAWLFIVLILLAGRPVLAADNIFKVGFVDLARSLNESEAGKKAKADLEFMIKGKQSTIDEKGKAIEKAKSDLDKQSSVLSQEARKTKEEELERMLREYQRLVGDSQTEVKKKEGEFTGEIIKEIRAIIQKTGQDEGYTMILENSDGQVLYSRKDHDLTDAIIKKFNASRTKK